MMEKMLPLLLLVLFTITLVHTSQFDIYWNVPSVVCHTNYDMFINVSKYGIIQNEGDEFSGDQVIIMYENGKFPHYEHRNGEDIPQNGGIPQLGDLTLHLEAFRILLGNRVPDTNFSGLGVIDMEYWRPTYRQNFASSSSLRIYQLKSKELERTLHPEWNEQSIEKEAERRFELYARLFMQKTLEVAREMRPLGNWGYYIYPMCFNGATNETNDCPPEVKRDNDKLSWLYDASDALYPSIYLGINNTDWHYEFVYGRVNEAKRVAQKMNNNSSTDGKPRAPDVLPYAWYRYYEEDTFLTVEDLVNSLGVSRSLDQRGVIMWGSTGDLNTKDKCQRFKDFVENTLGPVAHHVRGVELRRLDDLLSGKCKLMVEAGQAIDNCPQDQDNRGTAGSSGSVLVCVVLMLALLFLD